MTMKRKTAQNEHLKSKKYNEQGKRNETVSQKKTKKQTTEISEEDRR